MKNYLIPLSPVSRANAVLGVARMYWSIGMPNNARSCLNEAERIADELIEDPQDYLTVRIKCAAVERLIYMPRLEETE